MVKLICIALCISCVTCLPATLEVTDYGAKGDAVDIVVSVVLNSATVTAANPSFSVSDIGKVMCIFGAGPKATLSGSGVFGGNYSGTPTNNQDLVVTIRTFVDASHVTISSVCGVTTSGLRATFGTQNKDAFDACILAAPNPCTIHIPTGNYFLVPPSALDTNYVQANQFSVQPTVTINKGGIHFLGDGTNLTILTSSGGWQQKGFDAAYRGSMFYLGATLTNDGPMIFDGIQFNGNATRNHSTLYTGFPAVPTDGSGWDPSHHALTDAYTPTGNAYKSFTNCLFIHWHGETLQGIADGQGFVDFGNCWFVDGNATALNFNYRHDTHDCLFTDYFEVAEDGQFNAGTGTSYIQRNLITNIYGAVVVGLGGAFSDFVGPNYTIQSNTFRLANKYAVSTAGIRNVTITGNTFDGGMVGLGLAGNQGTFWNSNIVVSFNFFTNTQVGVLFAGHDANRVESVTVSNNVGSVSEAFGEAAEQAGSWSSNVVFLANSANKGIWSTWAVGQYILDDPSNVFPYKNTTDTGSPNRVGYDYGSRQTLSGGVGTTFYLDDTHPGQIPPTAVMLVTNAGSTGKSIHGCGSFQFCGLRQWSIPNRKLGERSMVVYLTTKGCVSDKP